ncbi:MAG: NAD(P)/FAD-dependent oxidoreductase [Chloroflexi bacterium]|nr:NAD(P)/FAD-dependent oxidoreductase [Chloroflexota bacterium]
MRTDSRPHIVIIGAGYAGLWAARTLARSRAEVWLIDRNNYHTFLPLLYQAAAAEVEPEEIAYPVRRILRRWRQIHFLMSDVTRIDLEARRVVTADSSLPYEYLVLATGSATHFFAVPGAAEHAFALKTLGEGIALRNHIVQQFEKATRTSEPEARQRALTFAIVGGGATGVEFAGALAELVRGPLRRDYAPLDRDAIRVVLIESQDELLSGLPNSLRAYASERLRRMGVEVLLGASVRRIAGDAVYLHDGSIVPTETVVWTAGIRGDPNAKAWGLPTLGNGRVNVLPTLQVPGHPEVYVAGDLANAPENNRALPMVAPVAIQEGVAAARNIIRQIAGQGALPFHYHDRGTMVTLGRNAAVASIWNHSFTGFPAWVLWLGVHLFNLIGFRNRLFVLVNWSLDYVFSDRTVCLILPVDQAKPIKEFGKCVARTELRPTMPSAN